MSHVHYDALLSILAPRPLSTPHYCSCALAPPTTCLLCAALYLAFALHYEEFSSIETAHLEPKRRYATSKHLGLTTLEHAAMASKTPRSLKLLGIHSLGQPHKRDGGEVGFTVFICSAIPQAKRSSASTIPNGTCLIGVAHRLTICRPSGLTSPCSPLSALPH